MQSLPTLQYQVLHLRQVEGKESQEIADIRGIALSSVPTLLSRARKRMLEEIPKRKKQS